MRVEARWEQSLHNQSALRLKAPLLFQPGVMVTCLSYQLRSSAGADDEQDGRAAGDIRRGPPIGRRRIAQDEDR